MVIDAWKSYAQLATGLTKTTRARAQAIAKALLAQAGLEEVAADASERVAKLADEILSASAANRQILTSFIAHEVDQAVGRLGLARHEDLEALRAEIAALRTTIGAAAQPAAAPAPVAKTSARKTPTKKSTAPKAAAVPDPAKSPAKRAAKRAPAKKVTAATIDPETADAPTMEGAP